MIAHHPFLWLSPSSNTQFRVLGTVLRFLLSSKYAPLGHAHPCSSEKCLPFSSLSKQMHRHMHQARRFVAANRGQLCLQYRKFSASRRSQVATKTDN